MGEVTKIQEMVEDEELNRSEMGQGDMKGRC